MVDLSKQPYFPSLLMISKVVGDDKAHGKFIKETALPVVNELVKDLDENYEGIIDEGVADGIFQPELQEKFGIL
jgi:hypothetical protein